MVGEKPTGTVDGAGETRCDRLMDWDCPRVILVLRHRWVLLLPSLPLALFMVAALRNVFLLLSHEMLLS